ncbi:MAG TPA: SLC13 family permease [Polyangiaceae bacterium]|nr:SLC13 family permease [Polyangiaceae bacterium]
MKPIGALVFLLVYVWLSRRPSPRWPLDRPAIALVGASLAVLLGALSPHDALRAIDGDTLLLLFGMMGMGAFLADDGFFDQLEQRLLQKARTPARLLGWIVWGAGGLSALITNDAVCVLAAPLVLRLVARGKGLPPLPFFLALATGANTGSVATVVGNPQNMLCASLGGLSYREHLLLLGPLAVLALGVNHALLHYLFRDALAQARLEPIPGSSSFPLSLSSRLTLGVFGLTALAYIAGAPLSWTAAGGFALLLIAQRRPAAALWPRVDWPLLVFFSGLFVTVAALQHSGVPARLFQALPLLEPGTIHLGLGASARLSSLFLFGSNIVSNVPFILLVEPQMARLPDPRMAWELLSMASTFAGNLTLLGSVANLIVAEAAAPAGGIGFFAYLRVGAPLALLTTALGVGWVAMVSALF